MLLFLDILKLLQLVLTPAGFYWSKSTDDGGHDTALIRFNLHKAFVNNFHGKEYPCLIASEEQKLVLQKYL